MARLGISIYPEHSTEEQDIAYIRKAGKLGYKRIFTCLLSVGEKSGEEIIGQFRRLADEAHACGMEIIPDVSPSVFSRLGISYEDLSVFREMHVDGIRLDEGFDGMKESLMTYNPQGLSLIHICPFHNTSLASKGPVYPIIPHIICSAFLC